MTLAAGLDIKIRSFYITGIFLYVSILCLFQPAFSQESAAKKSIYEAWISYKDSRIVINGYLYHLNDSSIVIAGSTPKKPQFNHKSNLMEISIKEIDLIKLRRKGKQGRRFLIGAGSGFITGAALAINDQGDYAAVLTTGISFSIVGGIIGLTLGSKKKKLLINGDMLMYGNVRQALQLYAFYP